MNMDNPRAFIDSIRASAVMLAAPSPERQLAAFRARMQGILAQELRIADVTWTPRRDLQFVIEELEYRIYFEPDDPLFFALSAGIFADGMDEPLRLRALQAAAETTRLAKVAKVFVVPHEQRWIVGARVDVLLPAFDMVDRAFVRRLIGLLRNGMANFQRELRREGA